MHHSSESRCPDTTYIDNYVWLPLSRVNARVIRFALMYGDAPSEGLIEQDHIRVPKHYYAEKDLPQPVVREVREWPSHNFTIRSKLREHQVEPFLSMSASGGGILNLGCGHGKTFVALHYIATRGLKAIVLVDKVNLIHQWISEALQHLTIKREQIGIVRGDKWEWDRDLVIASISTLSSRMAKGAVPEGFFESFGVAVYDECHHLSAPVFSRICPMFYGERHGLTATPNREDGLEQVFINHLGPIHYTNIEQELIPHCVFVKTDKSAEERLSLDEQTSPSQRVILDRAGEINHRKLCAWLGTDGDRNLMILSICDWLKENGYKTLCITHSVVHARHMSKLIESGLACGEVPAEERRSAIENNDVSFATIDVAAEALNVPDLSALIVMTPFGARTQGNLLQQALGRIQRRKQGKEEPIAIFIEEPEIHICRGLLRQVKRKLKEWEYTQSEVFVALDCYQSLGEACPVPRLWSELITAKYRFWDGEP